MREAARKRAWNDATIWLRKGEDVEDFAHRVQNSASGKRGEDRIGYALGVLCALETRACLDQE